jgi:hypothetical protein
MRIDDVENGPDFYTPVPSVVALLSKLTDDERVQVFGHFCTSCGCIDPRCQCWNDE